MVAHSSSTTTALGERQRQFLVAHVDEHDPQQVHQTPNGSANQQQSMDEMVQLAKEYCELFRHGMRPGSALFAQQEAFLKRFFAPQVLCGDQVVPPEAYVTHWQQVIEFNPGFDMQLLAIHGASEHLTDNNKSKEISVVHMDIKSTSQIVLKTVEKMFPHVLSEPETLEKLVGRELVIHGTVLCYFNTQRQVIGNMVDLDFLAGITKLLESPKSAEQVMVNHKIAPNFLVGHTED